MCSYQAAKILGTVVQHLRFKNEQYMAFEIMCNDLIKVSWFEKTSPGPGFLKLGPCCFLEYK